jgi:hypothetical protein
MDASPTVGINVNSCSSPAAGTATAAHRHSDASSRMTLVSAGFQGLRKSFTKETRFSDGASPYPPHLSVYR